ncbi:uncharacterized protein LOC128993824 [Macrosteles quadrilineatus]|uniref:uncharacterized protein LOC128993824 n=1 Tax=Macrosteles quadrilineatus TaxID=74068 RepID=UPI0023E3029A|nr:uncharacterized protein LOC128993824 [Macrosteles quadrilineatus]
MNLDGSNLTALHLKGYNNRGVYVLTVDTHKKRIYYSSWDLRNAVPFIDSCDYEGKNEKNIPIGDRWGEIHAVDVFRDILYFGHFKRGQSDEVWSVDLTNPTPTPILVKTVEKGFLGFKTYHPDVQKECKRQEPIK